MSDLTTDNSQRRIHIDGQAYHSDTPAPAEHLYHLGHVQADHVLYQEVQGNQEDKLVPREEPKVHLEQDEHFYSSLPHKAEHTIVVNARKKQVTGHKVSFEQIVHLAFPAPPPSPDTVYTVGFYNGPPKNPKGTMTAGQTVKIKDGMVFDVTETSRS